MALGVALGVALLGGGGAVVGVGRADMGEIGVVGSDGVKVNCVSRVGRVMLV